MKLISKNEITLMNLLFLHNFQSYLNNKYNKIIYNQIDYDLTELLYDINTSDIWIHFVNKHKIKNMNSEVLIYKRNKYLTKILYKFIHIIHTEYSENYMMKLFHYIQPLNELLIEEYNNINEVIRCNTYHKRKYNIINKCLIFPNDIAFVIFKTIIYINHLNHILQI